MTDNEHCKSIDIDEKIIRLEEENRKLLKENIDLKSQLDIISNSNGMKMLKKYYKVRDCLFPINTKRRLFTKVIVKLIRNSNGSIKMINGKNLGLVYSYLKRGDINVLLNKINSKLNVIENDYVNDYNKIFVYNEFLRNNSEISIDRNVVIDIIVPIYNAYEYTVKCIHSILTNTDIPYNLVLLNDCSSDVRVSEFINGLRDAKAKNLQKVIVIENDVNLGFVKNVNYGMEITKNDIVILNTDTEVPPNWLSRLIYPYYQDNKVCTVTPYSNCATIASFPNFCEDNVLPVGMNVTEVDKIFYKYGSQNFFEVPTGVGFCMFMSRKAINDVGVFDDITFDKGYGEENDWCRRAVKKGYKNVIISNLFVYHKHGVSFGERMDKSKEERIKENLVKLNKKHPEYDAVIQDYIMRNPNKYQSKILELAIYQKMAQGKNILYINHSMGGGATVYLENLIKDSDDINPIIMEIASDLKTIILKTRYFEDIQFNIELMTSEQFSILIEIFDINEIFINELCSWPLPKMVDFIINCGCKYSFFIHDFFPICPSINLINGEGKYCGTCNNVNECNECLNKNSYKYTGNINNEYSIDILQWRSMFGNLLQAAENVIAPSNDTAAIVRKIYPSLAVEVKEHKLFLQLKNTFKKEFATDDNITIGVIGAIGYVKGAKILYNIIDKVRKNNDKIKFVIIGYTDIENEKYKSEDGIVKLTGRYDNKRISELLSKYKISFIMLPNICPETFSYTASEAIFSGYPLLTFNIGAVPERIRRYNCGWLVDEVSSDAMYRKCVELSKNRDEIIEKASNLLNL